ncbi:MAG: dCTP deaminase [Flavobacteriales bacterium]
MILSGLEIKKRLGETLFIEPYEPSQLNPNSYNLRLHNELMVYTDGELDMKKLPATEKIIIPEEGYLLKPGKLYLGRTVEFTRSEGVVPMLEGRSSIGRLGLYIHVTAGFGDVGFSGFWTLEMHCIHPIRIYPGVQICQIFYHEIKGDYENYKSGKYQHNEGIQPSLLYRDFK